MTITAIHLDRPIHWLAASLCGIINTLAGLGLKWGHSSAYMLGRRFHWARKADDLPGFLGVGGEIGGVERFGL